MVIKRGQDILGSSRHVPYSYFVDCPPEIEFVEYLTSTDIECGLKFAGYVHVTGAVIDRETVDVLDNVAVIIREGNMVPGIQRNTHITVHSHWYATTTIVGPQA